MTNQVSEICEANGLRYRSSNVVTGGDISKAYAIDTVEGRFFLKINAKSDFPEMFVREADGLKALHRATLLRVPEVVVTGESNEHQYLLLQWLEKASFSQGFWEHFAEGLAQLHDITNEQFGWRFPNYIGSLVQENKLMNTWSEFYETQRIMPLIKKLFDEKVLSKKDVGLAEKLCSHLSEIFPEEKPALLHGDLWGGNFMATKSNNENDTFKAIPAIFDPAVYFGHREMDLGMSLLFGGFDNRFFEAYTSFFTLEKGWRKRISITQLYPLLVHAILFGGGYVIRSKEILKEWES